MHGLATLHRLQTARDAHMACDDSLSIDSRVNCGSVYTWNPAGNNKRKRHLQQAIDNHDGWIDVVVVDGVPGQGVDKASPWIAAERRGLRWKVEDFDPEVGHFRARAVTK